ncbi:hypothetical protein GCM10010912_58690 [Paenibacillus albidus]|uniref:Uncharacterized protein n=1 Tax=Paenibacillus albidus TaxID=2041023 RepID=A0A917FVW6_9BACL|nr:hypothetical protein [Paenibacillus albidus]GGG06348.1 hypothetical protein GCM10010912_58690 [Paenibacillus albidus]
MDQENQDREDELLRASFMGDIREDVQFLGLSLRDIGWIVATTLVIGGFPFLVPFPVVFKMTWIVVIFMVSTVGHMLKWPYRVKRYIHDVQQKKEGTGEDIGSFLGVEEDGWLYRSGKTLHVVFSLSAVPWKTAVYGQKRTRVGGFEQFLRAIVQEGFSAQISAEQIPDVRHELWNEKRNRPAKSEGIQQMKQNRIEMWDRLARNGEALRSEYTLTLTTSESKINIREREDEPADLNPGELKRFRLLSELKEKKDRVLNTLTAHGGHSTSLLSGFSLPEILGRWWDRTTWESWKMAEGTWAEPSLSEEFEDLEEQEEQAVERSIFSPSLAKSIHDEPMEDELEDAKSSEIKEEEHFLPLVVEEVLLNSRMSKKERWLRSCKKGFSSLKKTWSDSILPLLNKWTRICRLEWQKFRKRKVVDPDELVEEMLEELPGEEVLQTILPRTEQLRKGLQGIVLLTSPVPSGVSFLAANLGVAASLSGSSVSIVDLSKDQGTKTVLNPLKHPLDLEGWDTWSGKATDWLLFTPMCYPSLMQVEQLLHRRVVEDGLVIAEIPWNYPERETLMQRYRSVAVVDCDYHHWLQLKEAVSRWEGEFWLNRSTPEMTSKMISLLKEQYKQSFAEVYPYFPAADYCLYQGRPLALDPALRTSLNVNVQLNREGKSNEPAQTYESVS